MPDQFMVYNLQSTMAAGTEPATDGESSSKPARAGSSRSTRSKLWDPPEEDLPLLDSPLEVDSETPVADALIRRLQDKEKEGTASRFQFRLTTRSGGNWILIFVIRRRMQQKWNMQLKLSGGHSFTSSETSGF